MIPEVGNVRTLSILPNFVFETRHTCAFGLQAVAKYAEVTQKYAIEKKQVDELLGLRDKIYAEFSSEVLPQPFTEEVDDEDASPSDEKRRKKRWWGVKSLSSKQ